MPMTVKVGWIALLVAFSMQALVGYSVAFAIDTPLWAWHQDRIASTLWGDPAFSAETHAFRAWAMALVGATIASWAVAMCWVVAIPLRTGARWSRWAILTSTLAWFFVDTGISAAHSLHINVAFNVLAVAMIAVPLALTWSWRGPLAPGSP
jgi:hypothetical protein